jgi:hypothetical protein
MTTILNHVVAILTVLTVCLGIHLVLQAKDNDNPF